MSGRRGTTHVVADVVFTDDGSAMFCSCGWDETAATPERLNAVYQEHRVEAGELRRNIGELLSNTEQSDFRIVEQPRPRTFA